MFVSNGPLHPLSPDADADADADAKKTELTSGQIIILQVFSLIWVFVFIKKQTDWI